MTELFGETARFCLSRDATKATNPKNDLAEASQRSLMGMSSKILCWGRWLSVYVIVSCTTRITLFPMILDTGRRHSCLPS
jgi:hypothetical protein